MPPQTVLNEQPFFETHTPSSNFHQFSRLHGFGIGDNFSSSSSSSEVPFEKNATRWLWPSTDGVEDLSSDPWVAFLHCFSLGFLWVFYLDFRSNVRKCFVPILVLCSMDATVCKHSTMFVPALEICRRHEQIRCEHPHWSTDFSMEDNGWNSWTDNSCITCEYWILLWFMMFMAVAIILNEVPVVCETAWNKSTSALQDDESAWPRVAGYHGFWKNI